MIVYDHEKHHHHPYYVKENRGREASVYLKYIIDDYDYLHHFTVFIQDDDKSWYHEGSIVTNDLYPMMKEYFTKYLAPYIGPIEKYGDWTAGYKCCAQFIVHRDIIRKYPKKMYVG